MNHTSSTYAYPDLKIFKTTGGNFSIINQVKQFLIT